LAGSLMNERHSTNTTATEPVSDRDARSLASDVDPDRGGGE
jgi:hypothetical protein